LIAGSLIKTIRDFYKTFKGTGSSKIGTARVKWYC